MRFVDQLTFGPFSTAYHRALVGVDFEAALEGFLDSQLASQVDAPITSIDGTLTATFDSDRHCGPHRLVRNIFTLELVVVGEDGASHLKADILFDPDTRTFSPRTGHGHYLYLWTPARKRRHEHEMESIQRFVDDIQHGRSTAVRCPLCGGAVSFIDDACVFDVRCTTERCFQYQYHKDEHGRLAHGHFFKRHPAQPRRTGGK